MKDLEIKHVRMTFDEWNKIIDKKKVYSCEDDNNRDSLIKIESVKKVQKWNAFGKEVVVAEDGYNWLVISPKNENYVITLYMDDKKNPIICYVDMIDGIGIDEDGVFYYNDIFLDLLISMEMDIVELDRNELDQAAAENIISEDQKTLAINTADYLKQRIIADNNWLMGFCMSELDFINTRINKNECKIV